MISREKLIQLLNQKKAEYSGSNYKQIRRGICKVISIAHDMPTVDAVEVVRCKDCKRYKGTNYGFMVCGKFDVISCEDDFCAWGERKMDAEVENDA